MSDRVVRLMLQHGLVWLVTAVLFLAAVFANAFGFGGDMAQIACAVASAVMGVGVLGTWRGYVRWTGARVASTAALSVLLIAELAVWRPIWANLGCGEKDILMLGQHWTTAGVWCVGCALARWGSILFLGGRGSVHPDERGRNIMTPDAVRLTIGGALVPLLPGLFWLFTMSLRALGASERWSAWLGYLLCASIAIVTWLALWRNRVAWDARRRHATAVLASALLLSTAAVFLPDSSRDSWGEVWNVLHWTLPLYAAAAWFGGTGWAWRSGFEGVIVPSDMLLSMEQLARCRSCGYSLNGLREVRCPECGWSSTIDEVVRVSVCEVLNANGV